MNRLFLPVVLAMLAAACSDSGIASVTTPTPASASASPVEPTDAIKRYAVSGIVTSREKPTFALADARVTVIGGNGAGTRTQTDGDGAFLFTLEAGQATIQVSHAGYQPWTQDVFINGNTKLWVELAK